VAPNLPISIPIITQRIDSNKIRLDLYLKSLPPITIQIIKKKKTSDDKIRIRNLKLFSENIGSNVTNTVIVNFYLLSRIKMVFATGRSPDLSLG
jgi:hypothetical protein